jgi:RHS repeat-associated protein
VITQRAKRDGESTEFVGAGGLVWQYEYTLKDHLGNTRVTFADIDGNRTIEPNTEINQINHYYPFGLNMEGNWNGASAEAKNKYQYNGKELQSDFGLNWNDYGARMYDSERGQWTAVDPLAEKYNVISPYCYVANNPIRAIDPDGADIIVINGRDGAQAQLFIAHLNSFFGGQIPIRVSETNQLTIGSNSGAKLTEAQQYLFDRLSSMVNDHDHSMRVGLTSDHDPIDDYTTSSIDPSSIDKFTSNVSDPTGQASWYLHAFEEQWNKQVVLKLPANTYTPDETKLGPGCKDADCGYTESHVVALASQFKMTGAFVGGQKTLATNTGQITDLMYVNKENKYVMSQRIIYSTSGIGKNETGVIKELVGTVLNVKPSRTQIPNTSQVTTVHDYSQMVKSVINLLKK